MSPHNPMAEETSIWNVGFFVRKLPASRRIRSATFCVFRLPDNVRETLLEIAEEHRELFTFAAPSSERDICLVVARVSAKNEGEAAELARHRVGHYLDGISLLLDEPPPMAKVLVIQRSGDADGAFRQFDDKGWVTFIPKSKDDLKPWEDSREQLFVRLRPIFVQVLEEGWDQHSELFRQILFSARLFRRASETASYGLEYLCKWVAIEALTRKLPPLIGLNIIASQRWPRCSLSSFGSLPRRSSRIVATPWDGQISKHR